MSGKADKALNADRDNMNIYRSWREAPQVPADWQPKRPPGHRKKDKVGNRDLLAALRVHKPGVWHKIYRYAIDGSELHYFEHESGAVFDVAYHPK